MFARALIVMAAVEGLSLASFKFPALSLPLLTIAAIFTLYLSWRNLEWGIYILFGELFIGSRGHLLEYNLGFASISLRLVVFAAVFLVWLASLVKNKEFGIRNLMRNNKFPILYVLL